VALGAADHHVAGVQRREERLAAARVRRLDPRAADADPF